MFELWTGCPNLGTTTLVVFHIWILALLFSEYAIGAVWKKLVYKLFTDHIASYCIL